METETTEPGEVLRLPLWKNCYQNMIDAGLDYGATYSADFFEKELRCKRDTMKFGLDISLIRRALEYKGFYLSGRGLNAVEWIVMPPQNNASTMQGYQRKAIDALKRGVILGTNTRLDTLTVEERRKHESMLEKIATRAALISRRVPSTKQIA